jgi:hypothetical protein
MSVDRNEKIWSCTGAKMHAFVQSAGGGRVRALCRPSITLDKNNQFLGLDEFQRPFPCASCLKRARYMWNRAEASMAPATEADDLGHVAPVADEAAVAEALNCPAVMDALHDEALAMDREMDKRQAARKALTAREWASVSTDPDGSISGSFSAMKKLYDNGLAVVDPETGELVWAP